MGTITINAVSSAQANKPFTVAGTLAGYTTAPVLDYTDNLVMGPVSNIQTKVNSPTSLTVSWTAAQETATWQPLPAGSTVTTTAFMFTHPGVAAGSHTLEVTDGKTTAAVNYQVTTVAPPTSKESAEGTIVLKPTDPGIVDSKNEVFTLTTTKQIAVNGKTDPVTANVNCLYYHNHLVYQRITSGAWWYKANAADTWHATSSPVTHATTVSKLQALEKGLTNMSADQKTTLSQIISDLGLLSP